MPYPSSVSLHLYEYIRLSSGSRAVVCFGIGLDTTLNCGENKQLHFTKGRFNTRWSITLVFIHASTLLFIEAH